MNLATPAAGCAALFLASTLFSHTVALRLLLILGGGVLVVAQVWRARRRGAGGAIELLPPLLVPIGLWAGWAILSLAWSIDPSLTSKELRNEIGYALAAYWLCWAAAQAPAAPRVVIAVFGLGGLAVCVTALVESLVPRLSALQLHGGPGAFSSTLLILYPCTLGWAWFAAARRWNAAWIALPLLLLPLYVVAGYLTLNRILWIALAAQTVVMALLVLSRPGAAARSRRLVALAAVILIAGAGTALTKVQSTRAIVDPGDPRPALWQTVLRKIEERPLAGSGFGRGMYRHELRKETGNPFLWHSHSLYLDTALQLGWTGLALLLAVFGGTLALAWRLARSADEATFACGLVLLPLVAGTLVRNLTDVLWVRQSALLYWGVVGVLLAWGMKAGRAR
jgi:O-antigen ligase